MSSTTTQACTKVSYNTSFEARIAADKMTRWKEETFKTYLCRCGKYHMAHVMPSHMRRRKELIRSGFKGR